MTSLRSALVFGSVATALTVVALPSTYAQKAKTPKPACGIKYLPLAEGNSWTYTYVALDDSPKRRRGFKMPPPAQFTIEVASVETSGKTSTVTLKESYRDVVKETKITCANDGMTVDPQSFFYTGEIGGSVDITITKLNRDGTTWPGKKGFKKGSEWREDVIATVERPVAPDSKLDGHDEAKFEVERLAKVAGKERASTPVKEYTKAQRVDVELFGRAKGKAKKDVGIPDATAKYWFVNNVGLVRVENRYGQVWEMSNASDHLLAK